jgi:hypothetical protein
MKHCVPIVVSAIFLLGLGFAAGTTYKLVIDGKAAANAAIVVNGKTYVPLEALKTAGVGATLGAGTLRLTLPRASTATGGANQNAALEGCRNEWLFNGIWRVRVGAVEAYQDNDLRGWRVGVELRNGSKADNIALGGTGLSALSLVLSDGNQLEPANIGDIRDPGVAQGAGITTRLTFVDTTGVTDHTPKKLLLVLKPNPTDVGFLSRSGAVFTVKDPSLRFNLDCQK